MKKSSSILCGFLLSILVIINFLYNGYLLALIYAFSYALLNFSYTNKSVAYYSNWFWGGLGFATVGLLVIIGAVESMQRLTNCFIGSRAPLLLEEERLRKLLDEIGVKFKQELSRYQGGSNDENKSLPNNNLYLLTKRHKFYADNLQLISKIKFLVSDNQGMNAEAFGRKSIIVSKGLLNTLTDNEFKAVLVHEIAHLHYNDSLILLILFWVNLPLEWIRWLYRIYATLSLRVARVFSKEGNLFSLVAIIPLVLFSPIIIINYLGRWIMAVSLYTFMRAFEYRADEFTMELGFKVELISFLSKQAQIHKSDNSFVSMVFASHPSPTKRIARLESYK